MTIDAGAARPDARCRPAWRGKGPRRGRRGWTRRTGWGVLLLLLAGPADAAAVLLQPVGAALPMGSMIIDEVRRLVLPPGPEVAFIIPPALRRGDLSIDLGIARLASGAPGTVRFEISLRGAGRPDQSLFSEDISAVGWRHLTLRYDATELSAPQLVLRRRRLSGPLALQMRSAWTPPRVSAPPGAGGPDAEQPPSVILVSLDTLRADRVGGYGYAAARTPTLDQLARDGVLYEAAYSPSTWTVPSHTSLFFGRHLPEYPSTLRAAGQAALADGLPDDPLAVLLRRGGYLTAAFTGGGFLDAPFQFWRGFDRFYAFTAPPDAHRLCSPARFDGSQVFGRAAEWIRQSGKTPYFLFVHTYDAHDRCGFAPPDGFGTWPSLPEARARALRTHYDNLIASVDQHLAHLLAAVDESGARDRTLIVVTSDHGEAFDEHGERGHGCALRPHEGLVRVPLILRWPGRLPSGRRVATPVSLIDVAPTILQLTGQPVPEWMRGRTLPELALPQRGAPGPLTVRCGDAFAVRRGPMKLITSLTGRFRDELYNLDADPGERHDLAAAQPSTVAALRAATIDGALPIEAVTAPAPMPALDEATRERLRALGYVQ